MKYIICLDHTRFLVNTIEFVDTSPNSVVATEYSVSDVGAQVRMVLARSPETYIQIIPR
jgi:hypothetical protein